MPKYTDEEKIQIAKNAGYSDDDIASGFGFAEWEYENTNDLDQFEDQE